MCEYTYEYILQDLHVVRGYLFTVKFYNFSLNLHNYWTIDLHTSRRRQTMVRRPVRKGELDNCI